MAKTIGKTSAPIDVTTPLDSQAKEIRNTSRMSVDEFRKASISTCFRPDIYLNNDRKCTKCPNTAFCSCYLNKGIAARTRIDEEEDII